MSVLKLKYSDERLVSYEIARIFCLINNEQDVTLHNHTICELKSLIGAKNIDKLLKEVSRIIINLGNRNGEEKNS